jgi:alpha-galactosidase
MAVTKIVLIGAGSHSFGLETLLDLMVQADTLRGSTVVLNDVNPEALELMAEVARGLNREAAAGYQIEATTDQKAALDGAGFVITAVEEARLPCWEQDWQIPLRHGVKHVLGENGGPGGLGHTLRVAYLMLQVARNVEAVAPNAWLLNFTNPMSRVCLTLNRYTSLKVVGLCHQIGAGYRIVGRTLGLIQEPMSWEEWRQAGPRLFDKLDIKAAGLNHYTFIYDIHDRETGEDLYPLFRERIADMPADFEPLSRRMLDAFGLMPATGDGHAGEYVSFAYETSDMKGYDFAGWAKEGEEIKARLRRDLTIPGGLKSYLGRPSGERAIAIIDGILHDRNQYELSLNIPNRGCIPGLPDWAVVELPGVVSASGVRGLSVPSLPPAITALLNQQIAVQDRAVEAAVHGDREAALQALLLDPVVWSYEAAVRILDELLAVHTPYLPQFRG